MICVPVFGKNEKEITEKINKSSADIIEFRADKSKKFSLKNVIKSCKKPVIITNRSKSEGGYFEGNESERIKLLENAIQLGADYVDIEYSALPLLKKKGKSKIIVSYHNYSDSFDLNEKYEELKGKGDIIKIVGTASSLSDNLIVFKLLQRAKKEKRKLISLCMGEKGEISRILCMKYGAFLTYGKEGEGTAPGQIDAKLLRDVYRVNRINEKTKVYGLVGNPIAKSKGYLIHNAAFKALKLNSVYVNYLVEDIPKFMDDFSGLYSGLSITMPHKQKVMKCLDEVEETAEKIGAVNTVVVRDGKKIGYNTDWVGAIKAIENKSSIAGKDVVILGAGGAGRAIAFGIKKKGGLLSVSDTDKQKADSLAADVGCEKVLPEDIGDIEIDVFINATPIGMHPNINQSPVDKEIFKKGMVVFDAVYNPLKTKMLKEAEAKGCRIVPGVEMFVNQGIAQFEMWTGKKAPEKIVRKVVLESLA